MINNATLNFQTTSSHQVLVAAGKKISVSGGLEELQSNYLIGIVSV